MYSWIINSLFALCMTATTIEVPSAVVQNFQDLYPSATNIAWEKTDNGLFEAEFKVDGQTFEAVFLPNGNWMHTGVDINSSELPSLITSRVEEIYNNASILEASKLSLPDGSSQYELELKEAGVNIEVVFYEDGGIHRQVKGIKE